MRAATIMVGLLLVQANAQSNMTTCKLAVVGGGPGGIYTAWRLTVDSVTFSPVDVCVFERSGRVGGRTYSIYGQGTRGDLVVDLGAYRFCGNLSAVDCSGCELCMPMMSNLIKQALNLPTEPYEPGGKDHESKFEKIVDAHGANAGLSTYVDKMFNTSVAAGVRYFFDHEATSLVVPRPGETSDIITIKFRNASSVAASQVVLNLPLMPVTKLLRESPSLKPHFDGGIFPAFLRIPYPIRHVKFYVHYDWAWWRTLGKTFGYFMLDDGDCHNRNLQACSSDKLPLEGRYHDGPIICDDRNETGRACRGFLEATYTSDGSSAWRVNYFSQFQTHTDPPYVVVERENSFDGEELLRQAHERLLLFHKNELESMGLYDKVEAEKPTMALLSLWDQKAVGIGAGTHAMGTGPVPGGGYAPGAADGTVPAKSVQPFESLKLYIANEAFHASDFAEGSLEMAENIAHKYFGAPPPKWMASAAYAHIMFGSPKKIPSPAALPVAPSSPSPSAPRSKDCSGPFGTALPKLLKNRPSGTPVPDFFIMAAPFTPFHDSGAVNVQAISPLAQLFQQRFGVNAIWVMGMRGQFDTLTIEERKAVAKAWVDAGKVFKLFTIIQVGDSSNRQAAELAAHAEAIGADAISSLGPYEELCDSTQCVVNFVALVAAAAPNTPFFYYHTPGWNQKGLNGVKMYDWFKLAETKIPTAVGVKFESYDDSEFADTCKDYGDNKVMIYAPCDSLGHWKQGTPGRGAFIQAFLAPMCHRIKAAYDHGNVTAMEAELKFRDGCKNAGGNFIERYFYGGFHGNADFGHPRSPQPNATTSKIESWNKTLQQCGFYNDRWPSSMVEQRYV